MTSQYPNDPVAARIAGQRNAARAMLAALAECKRTFEAIAIVGSINADGWKHIDKLTERSARAIAQAEAAGVKE